MKSETLQKFWRELWPLVMLEERSSDGVLEGFCVPNGKQMATEIMEIVDCALLTTPLRLTQCVMEIRKDAPITVTLNIYN